ncbi:MAG: hypothetical protein OMM_04276 [Candidatus Magnetoglobus multicellularis str. Araruama]|uniref:histidine kinase n=1 Tax=Candidatus Magnetoglobus multicellularis str. Araruama TaxID=890399 RepID=A0A1V1P274_9BACT|nr:MAG: hypothetical protein OMM_04276 [Candidatus Magnetoglobus multicellularis str. Araruama]
MEDLFLTLAFQAHEKGLELVMDMSPDMPLLLRGDPARLGQILTNLVGNAIKFTHMGEVVLYIDLTSESDNTAILRFRVKDTGIGIPLDRQEKMFDHFTQVDTSHTRQYGGTGLGLAISKQLSEMMGGEIGLISEEGKGSEFWFTVHLEKQERQDNNNPRQSSELSGMRLLLVDDNDSSRKSFMRQMQSWNMKVSETSNGFDAIRMLYKALADNAPFQIAFIDKDMPGLNGEALGRAIKAETRLTHLKMVVLNCSRAELNFEHFQKIGFNAFLAKPFKRSDLKNTLIKHLS